jgi:hypothetical protein
MTPSPDQLAALTVIIGLGFLASVGANISLVIRAFRRNPPIDQTLHEFARSVDLKAVATKAEADLQTVKINAEIAYARRTEFEQFRTETQRACSANHTRIDKTLGELFSIQRNMVDELNTKLDRNYEALASWQRGIERQIGHLEAKQEG